MRTVIVLLVTALLMALEYHLGLRKKIVIGAVLPVALLSLIIWMIVVAKATGASMAVFVSPLVLWGCWHMGYTKSKKEAQKEIERMKARDI